MEVGIKQAKNDLSKLISAAQSGQKVFLMNRGQRIAEIVPVQSKKAKRRTLPGYGMFKGELHFEPGWNSQEARDRDRAEFLKTLEEIGE